MTDFRLALVVPVYNHGQSFGAMFPALEATGFPIIAVDDGSDQATAAMLAQLSSSPTLTVLTHGLNRGKGAAVMTGLRHAAAAGFSHVLQIDSDGQHDPTDIPRFVHAARAVPGAVVIGRPRFDASMPLGRRIGRYLTHVWVWLETLSFDITDSMCGFRIYPLQAVLPIMAAHSLGRRMDFDPEILVRLHWQGTPVLELDTRVTYPEGGRSNFRMLDDNLLITAMHTRLVAGMLWRLPGRIWKLRPGTPSSGAHWAGLAERGTLLGLRFMLLVYRLFGRWLFRPIALLVAGYFTLTARVARRASREFLDQVWTHSEGRCGLAHPPNRWTTFRHFHSFAEAILDKIAAWRGDIAYEQIDHDNLALFEARRRAGQGGIWITSHLGNIEVCRAIGQRERGFALTVLMHTRHAENFNRLLSEVAPDSNIELMEVSDFDMTTALRLQKRISQGRFIVIVGDRVPLEQPQAGSPDRVLHCDFLGRPARFPLGPFLLAALLDCPAGTLFCVRQGDRFRLYIDDLPELAEVPRQQRQAAIEQGAQQFAARLEALCVRYPLQWFNFFPFWDQDSETQ